MDEQLHLLTLAVPDEEVIYTALDLEHHPQEQTDDQKDQRQAEIFLEIDRYVRAIRSSNDMPWIKHPLRQRVGEFFFMRPPGLTKALQFQLQQHSSRLKSFVREAEFPPHGEKIRHSEEFHLFSTVCAELKLEPRDFHNPHAKYARASGTPLYNGDIENALVASIRQASNHSTYQTALRRRKEQSKRNFESCDRFIDSAFASYSRLCVARVDLAYQRDFFRDQGIDGLKKDLKRLWNNSRAKRYARIFEPVLGYIRTLEYAPKRGFYSHVVLILNGNKVEDGHSYDKELGQLWSKQITCGKGTFQLFDKDADSMRAIGLGMISRGDVTKRNLFLTQGIGYLTEKDRYFRIAGIRPRCLQTSEIAPRNMILRFTP